MATIPAHENEFPSLLFVEAAAPATPGTGLIIAYAKAGGVFAWKDDAGVEHIVGEGDTAAHLADATDAHDASAISVDPTGLSVVTGTDAQTAIEELDAASGGGSAGLLDADSVVRTNIGSNLTIASTTWADIDGTNLTIDLTTGARRVMLVLSGRISNSGTGLTRFGFTVDGTAVHAEAAGSTGVTIVNSPSNGVSAGVSVVYITAAMTAATHTFRPRWNCSSSTTTFHQTASTDFITFSATELYA